MKSPTRGRQAGFSLIELMVASLIGLLLIAATGQIFLSNKQSFTAQEAMGNIQENARLAMYFLQRDIRMAGYPMNVMPSTTGLLAGSCPTAATCTYTTGGNLNNPSAALDGTATCSTGNDTTSVGTFDCGNGQSDQIEVQFQSATDCLGRAVTALGGVGTSYQFVSNRYYVAIDPATRVRRLMCRSSNIDRSNGFAFNSYIAGGEQPIVEGIESIQLLYGMDDTSTAAVTPARYVRADQVAATGGWNNVLAVRVGVLAASVSATGTLNTADNAAQRYLLLDAPIFTRNDLLRRRTFVSTIEIRNRTP